MKNLVLYVVFTAFSLGECLSIYPPPDGKCKVGDCCLPWMKHSPQCFDLCSRVRVKCADPCGGERREDVCCGKGKPPYKFKACCYKFVCPKPTGCRCTKEYNPYCCFGTTYGNECMARCKVGNKFGRCTRGKCGSKPPDCICTMQYDPVCCDGITYGNACMAGCKRAKHCTKGECKPKDPCQGLNPAYVCCRKGGPLPKHKKCCAVAKYYCPILPDDPCKHINLKKVCCGGRPGKYAKCCEDYNCPFEPPLCRPQDFKYCCQWHRKGPRNHKCCAQVDCPQPDY